MAATNEMFELLVKITGDSSLAQSSLGDLKADAEKLNAKLATMDVGSKAFEETTTKAKAYGRAIQELEQPIKRLSTANTDAQNTAMNVSRVISDMPYGIQGIANNVDMLMESWGRLRSQNNSVKATFQALLSAMTGPMGIMMAVTAVTSLAIAFGDKLVQAIGGAGDKVDGLKNKIDDIEKNSRIDVDVRVIGLSALAAVAIKIEDIVTKLNDVRRAEKRDAIIKKGPGYGDYGASLKAAFTGDYSRIQAQTDAYEAAIQELNKQMYDRIKSMKLGKSTVDAKIWLEYAENLGMAAPTESEITQAKLLRQLAIARAERTHQKVIAEEKLGKSEESADKKAEAAERRLAATQEKLRAEEDKEQERIEAAQTSIYASIMSDVEQMQIKTKADVEAVTAKINSGALGEKYAEMIEDLQEKTKTAINQTVVDQFQAIIQKMKSGQKLTKENMTLLQTQAGFSKEDSALMGQISDKQYDIANRGKGKKGENDKPTTFKEVKKESDEALDNFAEKFEAKTVAAYESSVDLFSEQLSSAILQGGQSFSDILGNVASAFGQALMQFVIQALVKQAFGGIFSLIGFAEGTLSAPPGYSWVGEKGPELVRFRGGEEVVPTNQVHSRLNSLYSASSSAQSAQSTMDTSGLVRALERQTKALIKDRLNYEITMNGVNQIARATKAREAQISRYTGLR